MPFVRKPTRKKKLKFFLRISLIAGVVLFFGWLYYLIITSGPRRVEEGASRGSLSSGASSSEAARESVRLEEEFNELIEGKEQPSTEDLAVLREAAARQQEVAMDPVRSSHRDHQRLDQLNRRIRDYEAAVIIEQSRRMEEEAAQQSDAGDLDAALATLEEAHDLQRRVNREMGGSRYRDSFREALLSRQMTNWRAQPVQDESNALEAQAREAVAAEDWAEAMLRFGDALELQQQLNNQFPGTRFSSTSRVDQLHGEIASLETAEAMTRITALREEAETLLDEGEYTEAAALLSEAISLQRATNQNFPGSRHASTSRITELESMRQSALSGTLSQQIEETVAEMIAALEEGRTTQAIHSLEQAVAASSELETDYPRSRYIDHDRQLRLSYLSSVSDNLVSLHERVEANLREIPGVEGILLYGKEVPQSLYAEVMNRNPSRNQGADLPVDSVDWTEANEFCRRLTWILGRPVRLPTQEEFEQAAGSFSELELAEMTWNMRNSEGVSQPVASSAPNPHGFHDLIGNMDEWLDAPSGDGQALVAGGNYNDDLLAQAEVEELPIRSANTTQRSRTIGFRFVVEMGEEV